MGHAGLDFENCACKRGNSLKSPAFPDNKFDPCFAIESTAIFPLIEDILLRCMTADYSQWRPIKHGAGSNCESVDGQRLLARSACGWQEDV
jgi:hypothetical protein